MSSNVLIKLFLRLVCVTSEAYALKVLKQLNAVNQIINGTNCKKNLFAESSVNIENCGSIVNCKVKHDFLKML